MKDIPVYPLEHLLSITANICHDPIVFTNSVNANTPKISDLTGQTNRDIVISYDFILAENPIRRVNIFRSMSSSYLPKLNNQHRYFDRIFLTVSAGFWHFLL